MFLSVLLCRASSSFVFKTPPVGFHWFWPHFCYLSGRLSISGRDMSALIAAFKQLSMLRKGLLGESVLSSGFGGPALRHTRRSPLVGIQICPRLCEEVVETRSIHSGDSFWGRHMRVNWWAILPWSQFSVVTLDGMPSLSAALYCDLWPSKRCSPIRQDEHRCPIRHGP